MKKQRFGAKPLIIKLVLASAENGFGLIAMEKQQYGDSEKCFNTALELNSDNKVLKSAILSNRGELERRMRKFDFAHKDLTNARSIAVKLKKHRIAAVASYRLALLYKDQENIKSAILNAKIALDEDKKVEHAPGIAKDLELLSNLYALQGNTVESQKYKLRAKGVKSLLFAQ